MTIASVDDVIAGNIGRVPQFVLKSAIPSLTATAMYSTWSMKGFPGAASYATTINGVALSSASGIVPGQIPYYNAPSGKTARLSRWLLMVGFGGGSNYLCDRLWHNQINATSTSAQPITTPTWPARDENGSTAGEGVFIGLEVAAKTGAAAPTVNLTYTNSAGVSGRTASTITAVSNAMVQHTVHFFALQAGDTGVRSIQSVQLTGSFLSGTVGLFAFRIIQSAVAPDSSQPLDLNVMNSGSPKMYDGSVPFHIFQTLSNGAMTTRYVGCVMNTLVE